LLELDLHANVISVPEEAGFEEGTVDVVQVGELPEDLPFGELDARAGAAAFEYLERAIELASGGRVAAIATAPLNKEACTSPATATPGTPRSWPT
jgi:4-hydroxythreonine-4-phosphate dehydrogenase